MAAAAAGAKKKTAEKPDQVGEWITRMDGMRKLKDTHELRHQHLFTTAARASLMNDEGAIDYERLESPEFRQKFHKEYVDNAWKLIAEQYDTIKKGGIPKKWWERDAILNHALNTTESDLMLDLQKEGSKFNLGMNQKRAAALGKKLDEIHAGSVLTPILSYLDDKKNRHQMYKRVGLEKLIGTKDEPDNASGALQTIQAHFQSPLGADAYQKILAQYLKKKK
jgi:hypothetical protein